MKKYLYVLFLLLAVAGCRKDPETTQPLTNNSTESQKVETYSGDDLREYFDLMCNITKSTPGFFPPQVARAYGYVGVAAYESVVHGIDGGQSLAGQLNGLQASDMPVPEQNVRYNWAIASNAAMATIMRKMFDKKVSTDNLMAINNKETENLKALAQYESADVISRSVNYGISIAEAVYRYSLNDGGHESYMDPFQLPYTMKKDDACWVPTGAVSNPISPYWGNNRPFIEANVSATQNCVMAKFGTQNSSEFYKAAAEVYNQVKTNTPEQVEITKYWADDPFKTCTPTGHTFNIMTQLLKEDKATLEKTSVAYAKLAIAENDAFIACWKEKYDNVLIRPVSYIKKYIDPQFNTVIGTPPFPAFTSGHSAEIGAGTRIFTNMFTDGSGKYDFTDYSQLQYGFKARHYNNFDAMAEECADSRFYGGIHYKMDNAEGLKQGRTVGDNVNNKIQWPANLK